MKVKYIKTEEFYPIMCTWWDKREFTRVSPSLLPEYSFVVFDDSDTPIYSICLYQTDSFVAWLGWPVGNPSIAKEKREGYFKFLFEESERYIKEMGYHIIFTTTNIKPVKEMLEQCEFMKGDECVDHYLKVLV